MFEGSREGLFGGGDDRRGVSPVIGTVLMVALVVLLAAGIAVTVFALGNGKVGMVDRVVARIEGFWNAAVLLPVTPL